MSHRRYLLVEDSAPDRHLFAEAFSEVGAHGELRVCSNADEALASIRAGYQPDMIVLDQWLPGLSGEDFLLALKQESGGRALPAVVVFSGGTDPVLVLRLLREGAVAFRQKPPDYPRFVEAVRDVLSVGRGDGPLH